MEKKSKRNLTKIERIALCVYSVIVILSLVIFNEFLLGITVLIAIIIVMSKVSGNEKEANYLIKEKIKMIIRHFFSLCIFWNIIYRILEWEFMYEDIFITTIVQVIILIICLLPFLGIFKAISKMKKVETYTNIELYRELPQNIEPAIIAYLMQDKIADKSDISATLLDLVRRGYLIEKDDYSQGFNNIASGMLNNKLIVNENKNMSELKEYERFLILWFSKEIENLNQINTEDLKAILQESKTNYEKWEALVKKEANKMNFYDDTSKLSKISKFSEKWSKKMFIISICLIIFAMIGIGISEIIELPMMFIGAISFAFIIHLGLATLSVIIYNLRLPTEYLNPLGQENIRKWNGFIKFLEEYTLINERKSEEIHIWEEYLVYGVAFGVAKETINSMNKSYGLDSYIKE